METLPEAMQEIARIAAEAGARAAIEELEQRERRQEQWRRDRRLRNTRLLLENYRTLKIHCESAVFQAELSADDEAEALSILDAMMDRPSKQTLYIESIKKSAQRTRIIIAHIESMMEVYRILCAKSQKPEDMRRCSVVEKMYICSREWSVEEIAESEGIDERTVYKDRHGCMLMNRHGKVDATTFAPSICQLWCVRNWHA